MAKIKMARVFSASIKEVFEEFLIDKSAGGAATKTLETYKGQFSAIGKFLNLDMPIDELQELDIKTAVVYMREQTNLTPTSISSYTKALKSFLTWCNKNDKTAVNIQIFQAPETVKETYTNSELKLLLKKPNIRACSFVEYRNWVIINLLLNCGCRAKTLRTFLVKDVNLENQMITYRHSKNGKLQIVPLCSAMIPILREYLRIRGGNNNDVLFPSEDNTPLTESGLRQGIERYNLNRGVEKTSIHLFRHTFAQHYLQNGGNSLYLQKILGHSTLAMTKHYCNIYDVELVKSFDNFSPLANIK